MKSFFSVLLAVAMLLSFAACSGSVDTPADTTAPSDTTAPAQENDIVYEKDDLPDDLDLGGQTIKFISSNNDDKKTELFTEELNSDIVNDSIYNRENSVEERLHVEIEPVLVSFADITTEIEKQYASDEDMYQICAHATSDFTNFIFKGYFTDLYELNYIDFEKPWWSQKFNAEAEINGSLYVTTGSLSLSLTRYLFAIFYNKELANANSDKYPDLLNLYDIVDSGNWTFDKFYELGSSIYVDNNGSTSPDNEDTFGLGFQRAIGVDAMWSGFDINILSSTEDGWFEVDVPTEKLYSAMEKMNKLLYNTPGCFVEGTQDSDLDNLSAMFSSDCLLFMNNELLAIESAILRNMPSDYGILPFPKFDTNQKEHYSYSHDWYTSFAIPKTNRDPDTAAAVLEALASYAYRDTEPAYLNTALKGKYMSDPQSRKMLDLVVDGFMVDSAWIYLKSVGGGYPTEFRNMLSGNETGYASTHANQEKYVNLQLKKYKLTAIFD